MLPDQPPPLDPQPSTTGGDASQSPEPPLSDLPSDTTDPSETADTSETAENQPVSESNPLVPDPEQLPMDQVLEEGAIDTTEEQAVAPSEPASPEPVSPEPVSPEPVSPEPVSPEPVSPAVPAPLDKVPTTSPPTIATATEKQPTVGKPPEDESLPSLPELWEQVRPVMKTQTIRLLRATIALLEHLVGLLEAEPKPQPDPTTQDTKPGIGATIATTIERIKPTLNTTAAKLQTGWQRFQVWWTPILSRVRSILPASFNQKLSDPVLTGAIAGILVILLWTGTGLFASKPKPAIVATAPTSETIKDLPDKPSKQPIPNDLSTPEPTIAPNPSPIGQPAPTLQPSPIAKPSPALKRSPEQKLIASIQDQVADISNQYVDGLIQSVQANFRSSRLMVKVGAGWYSLSRIQQDKLANELLRRAQQLDFVKLELTDAAEALLARSPVVGTEMIILRRSQASQETV